MRNESHVTCTTLTGSQVNALQMRVDRFSNQFENIMDMPYDEYVKVNDEYGKQYDELRELRLGFLFMNLVSINNHIRENKFL